MDLCNSCGTTIITGAKKEGDQVFCSDRCYRSSLTAAVPQATAQTVTPPQPMPQNSAASPHAMPQYSPHMPAAMPQSAQHVTPGNLIETQLRQLHQGNCPKCGGPGPVDVHMAHWVWSALYVTSRSSSGQVSCRPCGKKKQILASVVSFVFGWWGVPFGLIYTPVQIGRNINGILHPPDPATPSHDLRQAVRQHMTQPGSR